MSLVLKFQFGDKSWLHFGDLEGKDAFAELLNDDVRRKKLETNVMMLPHHGAHLYLRNTDAPRDDSDYYQDLVDKGICFVKKKKKQLIDLLF